MIRSLCLLIVSALITATLVSRPAEAVELNADACNAKMQERLAKELRIYRIALVGQRKAEDEPVGTVRYEDDGSAWYKVGESEWRSVAEGFENTTHSDTLIDNLSEGSVHFGKPDRKGIFEVKRTATSELIPYVGQSLRAVECRLYQICELVEQSKIKTSESPESLEPLQVAGCIDMKDQESIPECHQGVPDKEGTPQEATNITDNCISTVRDMLEQEAEVTNLLIEYDAAYRSVLQFAGSFDLFVEELRWPLITTMKRTVNLMGSFNRIPCFLSTCEASPPPESSSSSAASSVPATPAPPPPSSSSS